MDYEPYQSENREENERASGRFWGNWRSCLLLSVMLLGLLATPLAVLYRWYGDRPESRLASLGLQGEKVNRIAFIGADHQLATIAPDGTTYHRLTDMNRVFEFPTWAPDGRRLAVIGGESLFMLNDRDLATDPGQAIQLYQNPEEPPFYLYWSPDGQYVSFLASHPDGIALHLVEPKGDGPTEETLAVGQPFYWDWAPAADSLLIHSGETGETARLAMIDLVGENRFDGFGDPGFFKAPGVSMSGRYQAYAELDEEGRSRLVIQERDGDKQWYEAHSGQMAMSWSPASDVLAYTSPRLTSRLGGGPLQLLDPRTNDGALLSNENVLAYFWSPDGRTIAYFTLPQRDEGNVRVASFTDKETFRARTQKQAGEVRLELWAVDVATGHQRRLAQFVPTLVFLRQFLPFFDQYALSHRLWSPDSDALVVPVVDEGRSQIAVVPLSRGAIRLIADGEMAFWSQQ